MDRLDLTDDFNGRYLSEPPPYQPKYRCCGKCGETEQEDPIGHTWDCLNPECKSHEMKKKIDKWFEIYRLLKEQMALAGLKHADRLLMLDAARLLAEAKELRAENERSRTEYDLLLAVVHRDMEQYPSELIGLQAEVATLKSDLEANAKLLARQCDLAREAETKEMSARAKLERAIRLLKKHEYGNRPDDEGQGYMASECFECGGYNPEDVEELRKRRGGRYAKGLYVGHCPECERATLLADLGVKPDANAPEGSPGHEVGYIESASAYEAWYVENALKNRITPEHLSGEAEKDDK